MFIYQFSVFSQVVTRRGNREWIEKHANLYYKDNIEIHQVSKEIVTNKIKELKKQQKDSLDIIGFNIEADLDIKKAGDWNKVNDTLNIWSLQIEAESAPFLLLVFDEFKIPDGNELYIYNPSKTILMGPFTSKNNPDGGSYATDMIEDNELILEYHQNNNENSVDLYISRIVYGVTSETLDTLSTLKSTTDGSCLIDVNCSEGDGWDNQKNGTCHILKLGDSGSPETSGSHWASASLLNNTNNDNTPYIFTAWHNTQGTGSDISLWIFRFKYWNTDCGSNVNTSTISYCGGQVLEEWENDGTNNDVALIQMYETPDAADELFYCGWNRSTSTPSSSVLLSHPQGGSFLMKIAKSNSISSLGRWWLSSWYIGGATSGSSGGPLFDENKRVIGAHHGRVSSDCDADAYAGKLSYSWNNAGNGGEKISKWLDPDNTGVTTLEGKCRCEVEIADRTINSDENIDGCDVIIDNVTIQNNSDVIIDAENSVKIEKDFEVKLGSTLEIK